MRKKADFSPFFHRHPKDFTSAGIVNASGSFPRGQIIGNCRVESPRNVEPERAAAS